MNRLGELLYVGGLMLVFFGVAAYVCMCIVLAACMAMDGTADLLHLLAYPMLAIMIGAVSMFAGSWLSHYARAKAHHDERL